MREIKVRVFDVLTTLEKIPVHEALAAVSQNCTSEIEEMKVTEFTLENTPENMQDLVSCALPMDHATKRIVPALFGTIPQLWSPEVAGFVHGVIEQGRSIDSLVHLSGEGKTCRLLAYGTKKYLIFVNCTQANVSHVGSNKYFRDESYKNMQTRLRSKTDLERKFSFLI
jgi:hypothetical protein